MVYYEIFLIFMFFSFILLILGFVLKQWILLLFSGVLFLINSYFIQTGIDFVSSYNVNATTINTTIITKVYTGFSSGFNNALFGFTVLFGLALIIMSFLNIFNKTQSPSEGNDDEDTE